MKKLDQNGLIPLLLCIIGIVAAIIYFAYTRVSQAR
jgi:hypothetical protein